MTAAAAAAGIDPAVSLPLLLGLSCSTGRFSKRSEAKVIAGAAREREPPAGAAAALPKSSIRDLPLPARLHRILASPALNHVAAWALHGQSWRVLDEDAFGEVVLGRYFEDLTPAASAAASAGGGGGGCGDDDGGEEKCKDMTGLFQQFREELLRWGFRQIRNETSPDRGSYYHEDFLRGHEDRVSNLAYDNEINRQQDGGTDGGGDALMQDAGKNDDQMSRSEDKEEGVSEFLAFTGASDPRVARQYLEMSGGDLETAASLFMDHRGDGGGGLIGSGAHALLGVGVGGGGPGVRRRGGQEGEEPDFYSLPPMPPLPSGRDAKEEDRGALPAERIVEAALREYWAFRTLSRSLLGWFRRRKKRGAASGSGSDADSTVVAYPSARSRDLATAARDIRNGTSHFLFRSMLHSSLPVRRAAVRMAVHNLHRIKWRCRLSNSAEGLREALVVLLHDIMFGEPAFQAAAALWLRPPSPSLRSSTWWSSLMLPMEPMLMRVPRTKNQAEGGDPALQLMAMLVLLVCDGGFSNIIVGEKVRELHRLDGTGCDESPGIATAVRLMESPIKEGGIIFRSLLEEMSSDGIESFVASGGLRWACGGIVRLVRMLVHGPDNGGYFGGHGSGSDSDDGHARRSSRHHSPWGQFVSQSKRIDDVSAKTIQARLVLLIDLVYRLVLFGSVPAAVDKHGSLVATGGGGGGGNGGVAGLGEEGKEGKGAARNGRVCGGVSQDEPGESPAIAAGVRPSRRTKIRELLRGQSSQSAQSALLSSLAMEIGGGGGGSRGGESGVAAGGGGGETSRTMSLRQSLRSSVGSPPMLGSRVGRGRRARGSGGGSLTNLGVVAPASGGGGLSSAGSADSGGIGNGRGGGEGREHPSPAIVEENLRRRERRRLTLERVHSLFWSSTLPAAAIYVPSTDWSNVIARPDASAMETSQTRHHLDCCEVKSILVGQFSPLACLVASHEILRSRPLHSSSLATNAQLVRGLDRSISILGRIVDPSAGNAVVVLDGDLPWGLSSVLGSNGSGGGEVKVAAANERGAPGVPSSGRKRARSPTHDGRRPQRRVAGRSPGRVTGRPTRASSARVSAVAGGLAVPPPEHRAKRTRTAGNVSSLLERLTQVEAAPNASSLPSGAGAAGTAAGIRSASVARGSSLFASRYRSAMESMLRGGSPGPTVAAAAVSLGAPSSLGGGPSSLGGTAGAPSCAEREGSLGRILASVGDSARPSVDGVGPSLARPTSTSVAPPHSRSLLRARAVAGGEPIDEWRVLHDMGDAPPSPPPREAAEGLMEVAEEAEDVHTRYNSDEDDEDCDRRGTQNEEEGEVEENDGDGDGDDGDDNDNSDEDDASEASEIEEVVDVDGNNVNPDDDDHEDDDGDEDDANYEEETDADDEDYGEGQFEDAVINLDEIDAAGGVQWSEDHHGHHHHHRSSNGGGGNPHRHSLSASERGPRLSGCGGPSVAELAAKRHERERTFLMAAMQVLGAQYLTASADGAREGQQGKLAMEDAGRGNHSVRRMHSIFTDPAAIISPPLLTSDAEQSLLGSLCNIVKPPRKPPNLKIFMRRAPTQEEFFRGSLSRNPISLSSLKAGGASSSGSGGSDRRLSSGGTSSDNEPCVCDLRLHIAKDLQMEDSAELLELLVANKILDMSLKLRVVQQVLWRRYVEENATSASALGVAGAGPSHQMISTGGGLSMIFSSSGLTSARTRTSGGSAGTGVGVGGVDDNTMLASFPPMVVTYRLAGVDGEATEDKVEGGDLEDPEAPDTSNTSTAAIERRMEREFGITRLIAQERGVAVLLASVRGTVEELLRRMRRDEVARRRALLQAVNSAATATAAAKNVDGNITREQFAKAPPCPGLVLLRHCANLADNRKKMLANRAPTLLLRILLDILNAMNRSSGTTVGARKRLSTFDFTSHSMDVDSAPGGNEQMPTSSRNRVSHVEGNPTTEALQEIIEMLASDISAEISGDSSKDLTEDSGSFVNLNQVANNQGGLSGQRQDSDEDRTLPLVLTSLRSTELSPPLRKVIAKLLPFLTYGQVSQSRELASYFVRYVDVEQLGTMEASASNERQADVLMNTFVEAAINLPPVSVCHNLRKELISNEFVDGVMTFLLRDSPSRPPPWSPALYPKSAAKLSEIEVSGLREAWRGYFSRPGLGQAFRILTGLCSRHPSTQLLLSDTGGERGAGNSQEMKDDGQDDGQDDSQNAGQDGGCPSLLTLCHWMESTSDNTTANIKNPNGILAETLLDALKEDNELTSATIGEIRKNTRFRKRELAEERRNRALVGMSTFGTLAGSAVVSSESGRAVAASSTLPAEGNAARTLGLSVASENRSMFASMFSSLLAPSSSHPRTRASSVAGDGVVRRQRPKAQPSWMAEMEAMADEAGATCAVCQEGRISQPSELLGMYAYVKKVAVPAGRGGGRGDVDGTALLLSLPVALPPSLTRAVANEVLLKRARSAAGALEGSSHALSAMSTSSGAASISNTIGGSSGGRTNYYVTTVSAGNAIHCSCHKKARTADRNHPKAPKSEWEGASLRNSRVMCNIILPLVSSKTSKVPLMAVETALAEYNTVIANTLGARPKSILWNCLHDLRFLLLRMAHGEALNADCGGGSSSSNFLLVLYQMYSAEMFTQNAEHDESMEISRHARGLSAGFLVAADIVDRPEFDRVDARSKRLERGVADAAPMAALCSILFFNTEDDKGAVSSTAKAKMHYLSGSEKEEEDTTTPSPMRQWELYKLKFFAGLIRCAGHRHSLGVTDSGCVTSRGISTGRKNVEKARSYVHWSIVSDDAKPFLGVSTLSATVRTKSSSSRRTTMIEEYSKALRPMITLYVIFDQLSKEFVVDNDDERTEESSERLAAKLESCYKADCVQELLRIAEVEVGNDVICKYFEKGATC